MIPMLTQWFQEWSRMSHPSIAYSKVVEDVRHPPGCAGQLDGDNPTLESSQWCTSLVYLWMGKVWKFPYNRSNSLLSKLAQ
jgi:hypothetical protein